MLSERRSVDVTAARAAPGVAAVWSGADIADLPPIDFRDPAGEALRPYRQPLLAQKRVRYGELRSVDVTAARAAPGVAAVWSGADIADLPPIDFRDPAGEALRPYRQPLLAQKRVRYVGEPVAAVFATDACRAEDAAELVSLTVEELAPVLDAAAAPGSFAPGARAGGPVPLQFHIAHPKGFCGPRGSAYREMVHIARREPGQR